MFSSFFSSSEAFPCLSAAFDRDTGKAKGFAHIQFETLEGAAKALTMSGQEFGNREIFIDTAEERTGGGGGGAGGAGFSGGERPQRSECLCYCFGMHVSFPWCHCYHMVYMWL